MVIYFPVSSLMTLFANILQNPHDARARADVKLMNMVVHFLSMLSNGDANSAVKRMLGICTEFERIANVVLDKAEKESSSRRKRKPQEDTMAAGPTAAAAAMARSTQAAGMQTPGSDFTSMGNVDLNFQPMADLTGTGDVSWMADFSNGEVPNMLSPSNGLTPTFSGQARQANNGIDSAMNMGMSHIPQQPFVPPDLWQMLDWDWNEMTGAGSTPFDFSAGLTPNVQ